jgi:cell division septum initiation protein DivIVA
VAISFSRPDPSSPAAVGSAQFEVVRRGFSQEEVRDFLRMVSSELSRLQERERFLESELRAMQTRGMSSPGALDEETITTLLGEETARVLSTAREAAQQMRLRAAETAERLVREASSDAARIRQEAELESARRRSDAAADVENEIELAKQQGRDMVNEAREYREKVLTELARRRELAREQIEQLIHARDRLVSAFDRARVAANDVVGDLAEFDDLSAEVERAAMTQSTFFDHTKVPDAIPQRGADDVVDETTDDEQMVSDEVAESTVVDEIVDATPEVVDIEVMEPPVQDSTITTTNDDASEMPSGMADHPSMDPPSAEHIAEVVQLFGRRDSVTESTPVQESPLPVVEMDESEVAQPEAPVSAKPKTSSKKSVDDLFASLKQTSTADIAKKTASSKPKTTPIVDVPTKPIAKRVNAVVPKLDVERFTQRDAALSPMITTIARKFKRVLADEENAMLTYLQGKKSVVALEKLLLPADQQAQTYVDAVVEDLMGAAMTGAKSVSSSLKADLRKKVTNAAVMQVLSKSIDESIVRPLRERIQRCVEQSSGDREQMASLVRSAYREWKMQRLDQVVGDVTCFAYSRGAYLALSTGTSVCWMFDPNGPKCPDAEDNALAGDMPLGTAFPTGHEHPIAHAGCRCLVAPVRD